MHVSTEKYDLNGAVGLIRGSIPESECEINVRVILQNTRAHEHKH